MDETRTEWLRADILVEGRRITALGPDLAMPPGAAVVEAEGMLALPGLINAHLHSPANLMRGTLEGLPLEIFMLYEVPPLSERPPTKRAAYIRTLLGAIEMLRLGITSVLDDAFFVPMPTIETIDGVMEAYRDAVCARPSRSISRTSWNMRNTVSEGYSPARATPGDGKRAYLKRREPDCALRSLISHWHGAAEGRLAAGISCSAPQRVTIPYFQALLERARQHDLPFVIHILENETPARAGRGEIRQIARAIRARSRLPR